MRSIDLVERTKYDEGYDDARYELRSVLTAELVKRARAVQFNMGLVDKKRHIDSLVQYATDTYVSLASAFNLMFESDGFRARIFFDTTKIDKHATDDQWAMFLITNLEAKS